MPHRRMRPAAREAISTASWTKNCYGGVLFEIGGSAAAGGGDLGLKGIGVAIEEEDIVGTNRCRRLRRVGRMEEDRQRGRTKGLRHLKRTKTFRMGHMGLTMGTKAFDKRLRLRRRTGLRHGGGGQRAGEELTVGVVMGTVQMV